MSGWITLRDGRRLPWRRLKSLLPRDAFRCAEHAELCDRLARTAGHDADREVTANLLYMRSGHARELSALGWFLRDRAVASVVSAYSAAELSALLGADEMTGVTVAMSGRREPLLGWRGAVVFVLRMIAHRVFRIAGGRHRSLRPDVVRTWVDVSERLFPAEMVSGTVLVYPFSLNLARQVRYALAQRARGIRLHFTGATYQWRDLLSIMTSPSGERVRRMAAIETRAYRAHGRELAQAGARRVLTSDEFEVGSWALHDELRRAGVQTINAAHGVGLYAPWVCYDEFQVLSPGQHEYYATRAARTRFSLRASLNSVITFGASDGFDPALVYIYQFRDAREFPYEWDVQRDAIGRLAALADAAGVPCLVKAHPNQTASAVARQSAQLGVAFFTDWSQMRHRNPVVVLVNSTIYFELARVAPVLVLRDRHLRPESMLGHTFVPTDRTVLEADTRRLLAPAEWQARVAEQRALLERSLRPLLP